MKLFSSLRGKIFSYPKSQFHFTTWTTSSPSQHNLELDLIQSISENPFFCLLNLCRSLSSLQKIHTLLIVGGESDDPLLKNKLVGLYGLFGQVKNARLVFDEMPEPDFGSCKVMIRWYFLHDLYNEVIDFHKFVRRRFLVLDNVMFSMVLKACSESRNFHEGRLLHGYIVHVGSTDSFMLTGLVDMYAKCGDIDAARKVFETTRERNAVCWTSMIVGYVQNSCPKDGLLLFNRMRECLVEGNSYTLGSLVMACAKLRALHQGKWVHGNVIKNGVEVNSCLFASILDMYVKCGAIRDARLILDEFGIIDLVSWTAMITGYAENGFAGEALTLFTDKKWVEVYPDEVTLSSVLSCCAQLGNLVLGSSVYSLAIKLGLDDVIVMNALVDMYGKCCQIEDAVSVFDSIVDKDVDSWNLMISGYCQNGYVYEALKLFKSMRVNWFQPESLTLVTLLSVCGDIQLGTSLHSYSIKEGLLAANSVYISTALLSLYAKCGDPKSARSVFEDMAMSGDYGKNGDSNKHLACFNDMPKENVEPTDIVFATILSACSHTKMIHEGWRYFENMCQEYRFIPSMRHYACMVDLLAQSGSLKEALEFIEKMPVKPDCTVFGAFLHVCSVRSRFDLGDLAVRKMLEVHPDKSGKYMLMSSLCATRGSCSHSQDNRVKKRGLRKQLGSSWVDLCIDGYSQTAVSFG